MNGSRTCPACHSGPEQATLFLDERIDREKLSAFSYASRKTPEFMRHRLLHCPVCDLVYADKLLAEGELAQAYQSAAYDSSEEADDAAAAYAKAIRPVLQALPRRRNALEIGTGTGIFLEHLAGEGFTGLVGVEPSLHAIAAAPPHRRAWIQAGMFTAADFTPASFDLICCFMTLEHVADPGGLARAAFNLLSPGGAFVVVTHDYRALLNRLLGRRSPIIDIEHLQLFSEASAAYLYRASGFTDIEVHPFPNSYALRYWLRLTPLPSGAKQPILGFLEHSGLARLKLAFNVGNFLTVGYKPAVAGKVG